MTGATKAGSASAGASRLFDGSMSLTVDVEPADGVVVRLDLRRLRENTRERRSKASAATWSPAVISSAPVHAAGFKRSASASSASRLAGSDVRWGILSRTIGCQLARNSICASGVEPSRMDGMGGRGSAVEADGSTGCTRGRGDAAASAAGARSSALQRGFRGRRGSGPVSTTCRSAMTAFQSKAIAGWYASISRRTSGSNGSRPTRTPPGVRKT